jgi:hypothetical protein
MVDEHINVLKETHHVSGMLDAVVAFLVLRNIAPWLISSSSFASAFVGIRK